MKRLHACQVMPANKPSKREAALTSAALAVLFMVVYGSCNWITSQRHDVGSWYYAWERLIPFVPLMIVPYMSIDLFYVAAPFLCETRRELRTFAKRITFSILVAGAFFLLMPLQFAEARPQPDGWTGAIFQFLHGFDQPYNLFPSLHITLRTILADLYVRHTRGWARVASYVWFTLIGFSTILTYQHHIVDVVGGFVLAAFCFYLFREEQIRLPVIPNYKIGRYYVLGCFLATGVAWAGWPWTGVLLWPAWSLGMIALGYFGLGPGIYGKNNGRLMLSTQVLHAPVLFGQHVSLLHYKREAKAWNEVTPQVWMGAKLNEREAAEAKQMGVTAVLDLTSEFSETSAFLQLNYYNLRVLDLTGLDKTQLTAAVDFISRHSANGVVYVHCKAGYSRSATVVGAYLLASGQAATTEQAVSLLRRVRPTIVIRPEALAAIKAFHDSLPGKGT